MFSLCASRKTPRRLSRSCVAWVQCVWDMCLKQQPSTKSEYKRHLYLHPLSNGNILTFCRYFLLPPLFQVYILSREQQFNIKEPFVVVTGLVCMTHNLVLMFGHITELIILKCLNMKSWLQRPWWAKLVCFHLTAFKQLFRCILSNKT